MFNVAWGGGVTIYYRGKVKKLYPENKIYSQTYKICYGFIIINNFEIIILCDGAYIYVYLLILYKFNKQKVYNIPAICPTSICLYT